MTTIPFEFLIEIVQNKEVNHDMWGDSDVEGWEAHPQLGWAFSCGGFSHGVDDILVWVFACFGVGFHLLHSNFHIIKWQRQEGGEKSGHSFRQNFCLNTVWVESIIIL